MKHILPIVTLTTLAAAASAQAAAGLNYNRVSFSRSSQDNVISAETLVGGNVLVGITMTNDSANGSEPQLNVGYVFKNVTSGIDATVFVAQGQWETTAYGINLRRSLSEILPGLEASVSYVDTLSSDAPTTYIAHGGVSINAESAYAVELAYNINSKFQAAVGYVNADGPSYRDNSRLVGTLRVNF
jgi:hypothetical protein